MGKAPRFRFGLPSAREPLSGRTGGNEMLRALAAAGGGFLLAVLWYDLMFDVQVLRHRDGDLPEGVLASIADYYRRVVTEAMAMGNAPAVAMVVTLIATGLEISRGVLPLVPGVLALALCGVTAVLGVVRIRPRAIRLATREDSVAMQSALARLICRDHLICCATIAGFLVIQLLGRRLPI